MFERTRHVCQYEQQFPLQKKNTILMGGDLIDMNVALHVKPEWHVLDCSNTVTLRDWLRLKWGQILGVKWGEAATELAILHEDSEKASELYVNKKTEMWFATGAWAEFGYLAFSPHMDTSELFSQLAGMRYKGRNDQLNQLDGDKARMDIGREKLERKGHKVDYNRRQRHHEQKKGDWERQYTQGLPTQKQLHQPRKHHNERGSLEIQLGADRAYNEHQQSDSQEADSRLAGLRRQGQQPLTPLPREIGGHEGDQKAMRVIRVVVPLHAHFIENGVVERPE